MNIPNYHSCVWITSDLDLLCIWRSTESYLRDSFRPFHSHLAGSHLQGWNAQKCYERKRAAALNGKLSNYDVTISRLTPTDWVIRSSCTYDFHKIFWFWTPSLLFRILDSSIVLHPKLRDDTTPGRRRYIFLWARGQGSYHDIIIELDQILTILK